MVVTDKAHIRQNGVQQLKKNAKRLALEHF